MTRMPWPLLVLVVGALAVGCGGAPVPPSPTPSPVATPSPSPDPGPSPERGGALTVATRSVVPSLDVHREFSPALAALGPGMAYSRLLRFQSGPRLALPSLAVECDLCASWAMEGPTRLRVDLRADARWHDLPPVGGRAVSPEDVVASLERQRTAGWPNAGLLRGVRDVEPEGSSVVLTLDAPDADLLLRLADGHSKVVPAEMARREGGLAGGPVIGSGPWVLEEAEPESRFELVASDGYFEDGVPLLDRLRVLVMPDAATRSAAFLTRILDVDEVPAGRWPGFPAEHPDARWLRYEPNGVGVELALNTRAQPLDDPRVRRALFLALDPWRLNQGAWAGLAYVGTGLPALDPGWRLPGDELRGYLGQPERSRGLLREAGSPHPRLELMVADYGDEYLEYGQGVAGQLRAAGFEVEAVPLDPRSYADRVWREGRFTAYLGPTPPLVYPNDYLQGVVRGDGPWNRTGYDDPEADRLVDALAGESDPDRRRALALEVQRLLLGQGVRFVPAARAQVWAWWPRVQGLHINFANYEYAFWSRVWVQG